MGRNGALFFFHSGGEKSERIVKIKMVGECRFGSRNSMEIGGRDGILPIVGIDWNNVFF